VTNPQPDIDNLPELINLAVQQALEAMPVCFVLGLYGVPRAKATPPRIIQSSRLRGCWAYSLFPWLGLWAELKGSFAG
jgi:hypothetical protein